MATTLGLASMGCAVSTVVVVARWVTRRSDSLGRPQVFPFVSVGVLMVLSVGAAVPSAQRRVEEHRLARVSTQLAGASTTVHCQTTTGALVDAGAELGFVRYGRDGIPEHATSIKRDPCGALRAYTSSDKLHPSQDQVVAVHVLTHESMHMRGETNEAVAECEAVQRDALTAQLLGASPAAASALAVRYWQTVYPLMPDDYRTPECHAGGSLDERLPTAPWS